MDATGEYALLPVPNDMRVVDLMRLGFTVEDNHFGVRGEAAATMAFVAEDPRGRVTPIAWIAVASELF